MLRLTAGWLLLLLLTGGNAGGEETACGAGAGAVTGALTGVLIGLAPFCPLAWPVELAIGIGAGAIGGGLFGNTQKGCGDAAKVGGTAGAVSGAGAVVGANLIHGAMTAGEAAKIDATTKTATNTMTADVASTARIKKATPEVDDFMKKATEKMATDPKYSGVKLGFSKAAKEPSAWCEFDLCHGKKDATRFWNAGQQRSSWGPTELKWEYMPEKWFKKHSLTTAFAEEGGWQVNQVARGHALPDGLIEVLTKSGKKLKDGKEIEDQLWNIVPQPAQHNNKLGQRVISCFAAAMLGVDGVPCDMNAKFGGSIWGGP